MKKKITYHQMSEFVEEFYNTKDDKENDRKQIKKQFNS